MRFSRRNVAGGILTVSSMLFIYFDPQMDMTLRDRAAYVDSRVNDELNRQSYLNDLESSLDREYVV